jgi:glycosyltransferase involved in cell wall biosynthesis
MATRSASVIIPSHDKLETLREVLRGLHQQSFPRDDFEVIVVDDDSTDGTRPFLQELANRGEVVYEPLGPHAEVCPGRVRNHGLARARGEIIVFLDADILIGPDFIAEHVATHRAQGRDAAVVGLVHAYPLAASERTPEKIQAPPIGEVIERLPALLRADPRHWRDGREAHYRIWPDLGTCPMPWLFFWGGNSSAPRRLLLDLGGFDEAFKNWGFEDVELGYRIWKRGVPSILHRPAWGFHYPHPTGTDDRRFVNLFQFLRKHPEPTVELNTFATCHFQEAGAARVRWEILDRLATPLPSPSPPPAEVCAALAGVARDRAGGPVAWFGSLPDPAPVEAAFVSRPFQPDARAGQAALCGLALPFDEGAFASAVAVDYWRTLSPDALRFVCRELTRVAGTCLLASTADGMPPPPAGFAVEATSVPGAQIQIVRRC